MALPVADPQFWIVTGAAAVALGLILRRILGRPKAGASNAMPCDRCPKAKVKM